MCIKNEQIYQHLISAIPNKISIFIAKESNSWTIARTSKIVQKTNHANILMNPSTGSSVCPNVTQLGKEWNGHDGHRGVC